MTTGYPFEGRFLDLEGLAYHYLDEGEGPPVLMVHGNPTWSFHYRRLVLALRDRHRVVVPDHIGMGRSDKPGIDRYPYTLARRVEDLDRLCEHLGLKDVTLVVHDWGGMIGMAWATRNPERLARLVVLNTAAFLNPEGHPFPPSLTLARIPGLSALLVRGLGLFSRGANRFCVRRGPLPEEVAAAYLEPYGSWANRVAVHRFVQDIPLRPSDPSHAVVRETGEGLVGLRHLPMMLCWGMKDFVFTGAFLAEWERRFPEARVHRFEDAGHYVLEDAADEIVGLVEAFLAEASGAEATA